MNFQGIVLRMLEGSESLSDVTHIIIDEVHERSIDSDFLLIVLREILKVRKDLKCVLFRCCLLLTAVADLCSAESSSCPRRSSASRLFISASDAADGFLRSAEKIADYMGGCPVVRVPGRTFPVTAYYLEDVVELTRYRLDPDTDSPYVARNKRGES